MIALDGPLFGQDEVVSRWVMGRIKELAGHDFGHCTTIGVLRAGHLTGGVVYNLFRPHADGGDINANAAFDPDCRISPATLACFFRYPFVQLGCTRMTAYATRRNKRSRLFCERTGFKLEGVKRRGLGREDIFMFGMLREECRYLRRA